MELLRCERDEPRLERRAEEVGDRYPRDAWLRGEYPMRRRGIGAGAHAFDDLSDVDDERERNRRDVLPLAVPKLDLEAARAVLS